MYMKNNFKTFLGEITLVFAVILMLITSNLFIAFANSENEIPKVESIVVLKGMYEDGDTINFNLKFSEDVVLTRTADSGIIEICINNPNLTDIKYTYNSEDFSTTIRKNDGLTLTYSVLDPVGAGIEIEQFTTSNITEFSLLDLTIKDLDGNELDVVNLPHVSKTPD